MAAHFFAALNGQPIEVTSLPKRNAACSPKAIRQNYTLPVPEGCSDEPLYNQHLPAFRDVPDCGICSALSGIPHHSAGEYAAGPTHTNSIESVWSVLKRGYYGIYHSMSAKHLARYVNEFTFRLNEGNVKRHSLERLDSMIEAISGKRLTYAGLTA